MKLTQITLDPKYDAYYILFVDGQKWEDGDDYHDKISYKIEGIVEFLKFTKTDFEFEEIKLEAKDDESSYYDFDYQPNLDESLEKYLNRIKKNFKEVK